MNNKILIGSLLSLSATSAFSQLSEKPLNIIYIMTDDHSYQTISAYDMDATTTHQTLTE